MSEARPSWLTAEASGRSLEEFVEGIERGRILNRSGVEFKPSVCRGYAGDLHRYVLPDLGARQLGSLRRADFQKLVGRLTEAGLSGSRVRNAGPDHPA